MSELSEVERLEAEAATEEAAARTEALTEEQARKAAALARKAAAKEDRAALRKAKRALELADKERAVRARLPASILIRGVDLLDLFQFGEAPPEELLPGNGLLVVRNAPPDALRTFYREAEVKQKELTDIYADVLCASCVEPDVQNDKTEGAKLRAFCEAFGGAAVGAGEIAVKLGGNKNKADKRGRA